MLRRLTPSTLSFAAAAGIIALGAAYGCMGHIGDGAGDRRGALPPGSEAEALGPPMHVSGARRLSRAELQRSMQRIFGDDIPVDTTILPSDTLTPFDNDVFEQSPSLLLVESLETIA